MRVAIIAAVLFAASANAMADFADEFQKAKGLFHQRKYEDAAEAFSKLATSAPNAHGKAWSQYYAAAALGRLKKYDQAVELAKTIEDEPMAAYAQMEVMSVNRKYKELIAAFKNEDLAAWPDQINYHAFFLRGAAYAALRDAQAAVKDLRQCADLAGSDDERKLAAMNRLAALCGDLKDEARAMETYEKALAIYDAQPRWKGKWLFPQTLLGAARLLMGQGKHDEALAMLARFDDWPHKKPGSWNFQILEAYGDIRAAQGRTEEAFARYREALAIDTHKTYIARVQKKVETLKKKQGAAQ